MFSLSVTYSSSSVTPPSEQRSQAQATSTQKKTAGIFVGLMLRSMGAGPEDHNFVRFSDTFCEVVEIDDEEGGSESEPSYDQDSQIILKSAENYLKEGRTFDIDEAKTFIAIQQTIEKAMEENEEESSTILYDKLKDVEMTTILKNNPYLNLLIHYKNDHKNEFYPQEIRALCKFAATSLKRLIELKVAIDKQNESAESI